MPHLGWFRILRSEISYLIFKCYLGRVIKNVVDKTNLARTEAFSNAPEGLLARSPSLVPVRLKSLWLDHCRTTVVIKGPNRYRLLMSKVSGKMVFL